MNRFILTTAAVAVLGTVDVVAQDGIPEDAALPGVKTIWLQTNGCTSQLITELQAVGYTLTSNRQSAEAIMQVDVQQLDADTGASASFSATLRDQTGKELFSATGREDSIQEKLCADIGETIAERIEERRSAVR